MRHSEDPTCWFYFHPGTGFWVLLLFLVHLLPDCLRWLGHALTLLECPHFCLLISAADFTSHFWKMETFSHHHPDLFLSFIHTQTTEPLSVAPKELEISLPGESCLEIFSFPQTFDVSLCTVSFHQPAKTAAPGFIHKATFLPHLPTHCPLLTWGMTRSSSSLHK